MNFKDFFLTCITYEKPQSPPFSQGWWAMSYILPLRQWQLPWRLSYIVTKGWHNMRGNISVLWELPKPGLAGKHSFIASLRQHSLHCPVVLPSGRWTITWNRKKTKMNPPHLQTKIVPETPELKWNLEHWHSLQSKLLFSSEHYIWPQQGHFVALSFFK